MQMACCDLFKFDKPTISLFLLPGGGSSVRCNYVWSLGKASLVSCAIQQYPMTLQLPTTIQLVAISIYADLWD